MKKPLLFVGLLLLVLPLMSQSRKYIKAMKPAVETMHSALDAANELELAGIFEEISGTYPDQWLPAYHAGRILTVNSFVETDMKKKEALLERAKKSLDMALELVPDESEVQVLNALYYIGLMSTDPETMGPAYYQDALDAIEKSKNLNPGNPRAWYMDGMMTMNMPEFLGGGPEAAKPAFQEAMNKFGTFRNEDPFWPDWGKDLVQTELERMK
ncbi:MAG: hypothetical protein P1P86_10385 [Bacteroidales bacterium]|nr:hypothetical protein [Bacteroidales bacterium]